MHISLNGSDWLFKDFIGEDWSWRNSHKPNTRDTRHWKRGNVPGSVQDDLWRAGEIPDPYFERNSRLIEWVPQRTWIYKKTFTVDAAHQGQRVQLHFKGVDYEAQFFLNGERLGAHRGMYTPAMFEVGDRLKFGVENLLAVVVEHAPDELPQVGRSEQVRTHKSRMGYWWDFCPRMVHLGIWDDVYLDITGAVLIADVFVRPQLADDFSRADVSVSTTLDTDRHATVEVETSVEFEGQTIATERTRHALAPGQTALNICLPVESPRLWFPNGHGEQPLYTALIRVLSMTKEESDERIVTFGIREIKFARNDTPDETARPYTFVVNGKRIYAKGWNWVPMDVLYGVPRPEKLERLLTLAQRANVNLLRVWGGGLIEKDAFYDACDRRGIMVWQEFIQSSSGISNQPPTNPEFIAMMVREAEQIIPRKRNHASLALWCGGNELETAAKVPCGDDEPVLAALRQVIARLDPDRLWLPTSASGPTSGNSLVEIEKNPLALHDVHGPWEHQGLVGQYTLYNRGTSLYHSEFGAEGITNLKSLLATISREHVLPVSLDNPLWHHLGAWWVKEPTWREAFGEIKDIETYVRATQFLQAEGVRYAVEADRRRQWRNSGTNPWQFNEPYPMAACTSAVDYYAMPKPLYFAVARAYAPLALTAQFARQAWAGESEFAVKVWVSNSGEFEISNWRLQIRVVGASGRCYADQVQTVSFCGNGSTRLTEYRMPLAEIGEDVFFLDLEMSGTDWQPAQHSRYLFSRTANLAPMFAVPQTTLDVQANGDSIAITNTGNSAALLVELFDARDIHAPGYAYFSDSHFTLLPGECRTIAVEWRGVRESERRVEVRGWNAMNSG